MAGATTVHPAPKYGADGGSRFRRAGHRYKEDVPWPFSVHTTSTGDLSLARFHPDGGPLKSFGHPSAPFRPLRLMFRGLAASCAASGLPPERTIRTAPKTAASPSPTTPRRLTRPRMVFGSSSNARARPRTEIRACGSPIRRYGPAQSEEWNEARRGGESLMPRLREWNGRP